MGGFFVTVVRTDGPDQVTLAWTDWRILWKRNLFLTGLGTLFCLAPIPIALYSGHQLLVGLALVLVAIPLYAVTFMLLPVKVEGWRWMSFNSTRLEVGWWAAATQGLEGASGVSGGSWLIVDLETIHMRGNELVIVSQEGERRVFLVPQDAIEDVLSLAGVIETRMVRLRRKSPEQMRRISSAIVAARRDTGVADR